MFRFALLFSVFSVPGLALAEFPPAQSVSRAEREVLKIPQPGPPLPLYSRSELALSTATGALFGFGLGQAIERRWLRTGVPFAIADSLALALMLGQRGGSSWLRTGGQLLFWGSKLAQTGELMHFGVQQGMLKGESLRKVEPGMRITIAPTSFDLGAGVATAVSLDF